MTSLLERLMWGFTAIVISVFLLWRVLQSPSDVWPVASTSPPAPTADVEGTHGAGAGLGRAADAAEAPAFESVLSTPGGSFDRLFGHVAPSVPRVEVAPPEPEPDAAREPPPSNELVFVGRVVTDGGRTVYTFTEPSTGLVLAFEEGENLGRWALRSVTNGGFIFFREGSGEGLIGR